MIIRYLDPWGSVWAFMEEASLGSSRGVRYCSKGYYQRYQKSCCYSVWTLND